MDRNHDGNSTEDGAGGFRRVPDPELGVDVIEMWTGGAPGPDSSICDVDAGWVQITDPEVVEITEFSINDNLSYTEVIQTDAAGNPTLSQVVRKFRINLQGQLVFDDDIKRNVQDVISVRNDILL